METNEPVWPKDHLISLLSAMKNNIPKREICRAYTRTQKTLDWEEVAFHPYSSEQCKLKWQQMLDKMRKTRSLTELIDEAECVIENPFTRKNLKIHPEFQSRPLNELSLFMKDKRNRYKKKNPDADARQMLKLMSKGFKNLPQRKKDKYAKKFKLACEEYEQRTADYRIQNYSDKMPQRLKYLGGRLTPKRKSKDDKAGLQNELNGEGEHQADRMPVKAPVNGFALFAREQRASSKGATSSSLEHIKVCGKHWKQMTQTRKEEYNRRCRELKKQYEESLKQFVIALPKEEQKLLFLTNDGKKMIKDCKNSFNPIKRIFPGEPKQPPRSGNSLYCAEMIRLLGDTGTKRGALGTFSRAWKSLSEESKQHYQRQASDNFKRYMEELRQWFSTLTPKEQEEYLENKPRQRSSLGTRDVVSGRFKPTNAQDSEDDTEESSSEEEEEEEEELDSDSEEELEDGKLWTHERIAVEKHSRPSSSSESDAGD